LRLKVSVLVEAMSLVEGKCARWAFVDLACPASVRGDVIRTRSPTIGLVRYVWLAIIAVGLLPVALLGFFANPLVFIVLATARNDPDAPCSSKISRPHRDLASGGESGEPKVFVFARRARLGLR
jgi:hypothetical protein